MSPHYLVKCGTRSWSKLYWFPLNNRLLCCMAKPANCISGSQHYNDCLLWALTHASSLFATDQLHHPPYTLVAFNPCVNNSLPQLVRILDWYLIYTRAVCQINALTDAPDPVIRLMNVVSPGTEAPHVAYGRGSALLRHGDEIPRGRGSLGGFLPHWQCIAQHSISDPYKNGWTDRDAVWDDDSGRP